MLPLTITSFSVLTVMTRAKLSAKAIAITPSGKTGAEYRHMQCPTVWAQGWILAERCMTTQILHHLQLAPCPLGRTG